MHPCFFSTFLLIYRERTFYKVFWHFDDFSQGMKSQSLEFDASGVISRMYKTFHSSRSSHQRWSVEEGVLRNFAKFTGKHLCQRLFFNKVVEAWNFIKASAPLFLHIFVNLCPVNLWQSFMAFLIIFHEVMKLQSFEWLDGARNY